MKVLFAASELAPWVKTGGLGDVAAALPPALRALGLDVRVLLPRYPAMQAAFPDARYVAPVKGLGGHFFEAALFEAEAPDGTPLFLLDCHPYFDRPGSPYLGPEGHDWLDNVARFGLLSRVAAWLGSPESPLRWRPDILHCNDWQTGLAPAYLHYLHATPRAKTVVTVHNLAFQGIFDRATLVEIGLPPAAWSMDGVEYYGYLSFLKSGLQLADAITTVSPTYAREIQTPEEGMGMDGLLRHRADRITGILNGIDTAAWDASRDPHLAAHYDIAHIDAKAASKNALRRELGLAEDDGRPLLAVVSRLTHQKGLDLVAGIADKLAALHVQLVVLGNGEKALEKAFTDIAARHPGQFAVRIGFDEGLAHRIEAGADIFLMPSRFEPCGLNQMYSLRYGTPPVVRATGGLADTVTEDVNGFVFEEPSTPALLAAIRRAVEAWRDKRRWRRLQKNGMSQDLGWNHPAREYAALYARLAAK